MRSLIPTTSSVFNRAGLWVRHSHRPMPPSSCFATVTGVDHEASGKARRWEIPWGTGRNGEPITLTRTLETVPGVEDDDEDKKEDEGRTQGDDRFTVMTFNMLAQTLASSDVFPYVKKGELKKKARGPRHTCWLAPLPRNTVLQVQEELCRYGADIICLQECDNSYHDVLVTLNDKAGAEGAEYQGVRPNNLHKSHGVAVLFNSKVFRLLACSEASYYGGQKVFDANASFVVLEDTRRTPSTQENQPPLDDDGGQVSKGTGAAKNEGDESARDFPRPISSVADGHGGEVDGRIDDGLPVVDSSSASGSSEDGVATQKAGGDAGNDGEGRNSFDASMAMCVVTTHLYWHPEGEHVRGAQLEYFMKKLEQFLKRQFRERFSSVPLVLAADLNTLPGVGAYRMLSQGSLWVGEPKTQDSRIRSHFRRERGKKRSAQQKKFRQAFRGLTSAYGVYGSVFGSQLERDIPLGESSTCARTGNVTIGHLQMGARKLPNVIGKETPAPSQQVRSIERIRPGANWAELARGEPEFTTCTAMFAGTLDYIWHSRHFKARSLLGLPSLKQAMQEGGLPNAMHGSDHVTVMAELQWAPTIPAAADTGTPRETIFDGHVKPSSASTTIRSAASLR